MIEFFNFYLIPGIVVGCIYALAALGISLTFGILRFANFAHGDTMTLGAYFIWTFVALVGMPPVVAWIPAAVLTIIIILACDRLFFKPLRQAPTVVLLIASFGFMLMLRSAIQLIWGVANRTLIPGIQQPWVFFDAIRIVPRHFWIVGAAIVLMVGLHLILTRTKIGKAMRATSDNPILARLSGIATERVVAATWIISTTLAVVAGLFLAIDTDVNTLMGYRMLLPIFAAAILGGIGKPYGAMAGGLVIGLAEELSVYHWLGDDPLISPAYKGGVAFAVMVVMLIWRPAGLGKGRVF
ncbi:MAG: branched-chain amino acid ABC transporter permease [Pseudomonadota bacterium]